MADPMLLAAAIARIEDFTRRGMLAEAEQECFKLIQEQPAVHQGWAWLGVLRLVGQRFSEAEAALRQAIALHAGDAHYWTNAALALRAQGKASDAEAFARQAAMIDPSNAVHWAGLGAALCDQRRYEDAANAYREALARDDNNAATWAELGAAEHALGRFAAAQQAYERSLELEPGNALTITKYATLQVDCGQVARGVALLQTVVQQTPDVPLAWLTLGRAYRMLDDLLQAEAAFRHAVQLLPRSREARHDLALVLLARWAHPEAEALIRQLIADEPTFAEAWLLLGVVLHVQARIDEALPALRQAVELAPTPVTYGKLLVSLPYADAATPEALLAEHRAWDVAFARPLMPATPPAVVAKSSNQPLRLGFVACDFSAGPTGFLALRAIEWLDKSQCQVVCYSDRLREDEYTPRFRAASELWRPTLGINDESLAEQIRADEIDVLFDLGGHVGARLLTFARKPAPLQVTWLGYVGTTGMDAMDCLLADRYHVREGEDHWYAEQVLRMPHGYACYGPPPATPEVGPLPALTKRRFTFGSFNNPVKITPRLLDMWTAILVRVPGSQLLLKYAGLQQPHLQRWLHKQFAERGVSADRIVLEGWSPHAELLASYNRIDLALDTQPYSGGLTTCESLWMGVPVITHPGETFAGRHSTSYLTNVGYQHFVAADRDAYVELAVGWAGRLNELAAIRAGLREQMQNSPVCDAPRFARDLLSLLRETWNREAALA